MRIRNFQCEVATYHIFKAGSHRQIAKLMLKDFLEGFLRFLILKVHKNENFFGFDFEFCTISMLVMHK